MIELLVYAGAKAVARGASVAGKSIATRQAKAQAEADAETSDWAAKALARFGSVPEEAAPASLPSQLAKASPAPRTRMRPSTIIISGPRRSPGFVGTNMKPARAPATLAARPSSAAAAAPVATARQQTLAPTPAKSRLLAANPAAYRAPVTPAAPKPSPQMAAPPTMPAARPAPTQVAPPTATPTAAPVRQPLARPFSTGIAPQARATFGKRPASTG